MAKISLPYIIKVEYGILKKKEEPLEVSYLNESRISSVLIGD